MPPAPHITINDSVVEIDAFDPNESLLALLRDRLALTGTKEGCASGDCGACTVMVQSADGSTHTVNSCITPSGAALGQRVITVEGIGAPDNLHPVQQAMVDQHGSQCGFCTPGFIVSLTAFAQDALAQSSRSDCARAISGNLCRCTGYRPILAAAQQALAAPAEDRTISPLSLTDSSAPATYAKPVTLPELLAHMRERPDRARWPLAAGTTDLWLAVSQRYQDFDGFIDVSDVAELNSVEHTPDGLMIGAGVRLSRLTELFASTSARCPAFVEVLHRFGSPQIRSRATLGGNLAGGSPIADSAPLLLALDAAVMLAASTGDTRALPLAEFFIDYRRTALAADEIIVAITIPAAIDLSTLRAHKISKREEDDISSVLVAVNKIDDSWRVALGGVAATPRRVAAVEAVLNSAPLSIELIDSACKALAKGITPLSDVRASADYRRATAEAVLRRMLLAELTGSATNIGELPASAS